MQSCVADFARKHARALGKEARQGEHGWQGTLASKQEELDLEAKAAQTYLLTSIQKTFLPSQKNKNSRIDII